MQTMSLLIKKGWGRFTKLGHLPKNRDPMHVILFCRNMHVRMIVIKTWCGAWTTSYRMREKDLLDCLFGCHGEKDNIAHYLRCPCLWKTIDKVLLRDDHIISVRSDLGCTRRGYSGETPPPRAARFLAVGSELASTYNHLDRLSMIPPNRGAIRGLALAFSTYHAIKHQK